MANYREPLVLAGDGHKGHCRLLKIPWWSQPTTIDSARLRSAMHLVHKPCIGLLGQLTVNCCKPPVPASQYLPSDDPANLLGNLALQQETPRQPCPTTGFSTWTSARPRWLSRQPLEHGHHIFWLHGKRAAYIAWPMQRGPPALTWYPHARPKES